jgi:hypothetical protein
VALPVDHEGADSLHVGQGVSDSNRRLTCLILNNSDGGDNRSELLLTLDEIPSTDVTDY